MVVLMSALLLAMIASTVEPGSVAGIVTGPDMHPIAGATVVVEGGSTGCMTGPDGRFVIEGIVPGPYVLRFSCVGYAARSVTDVIVRPGRTTSIDMSLGLSPVDAGVVTVRPDYFERDPSMPSGSVSMSGEQVRRAPGSAGDVIRVLNSLPSTARFDETWNGLAVRGGNPSETAFLLDGMEISNINHFPRQGTSGGGLSMLNTDLLEGVEFMAGGFPARYGGRMSSVVSISTREGDRESFQGQADFGMAGFGAVLEGPLGGSGSWLVCARRSWVDLLVEIADVDAVPVYSDMQGRITLDAGPSDRLVLVTAGSLDRVDYGRVRALADGNRDYGTTEGHILFGGASWRRLLGGEAFSTLSLSFNETMYGGEYRRTSTEELSAVQDSRERSATASGTLTARTGFATIGAGFDARLHADDFDNFYAADTNYAGEPMPELIVDARDGSFDGGVFVECTAPAGPLETTLGCRLDLSRTGAAGLSPRASLSLRLTEALTVEASGGVYRQSLSGELLARDRAYRELPDPWALHGVLGIGQLLSEDSRLTLEAYLKSYRDCPWDPEQPGFSILDGLSSEQGLYTFDTLASGGEARAAGVELMLEKKLVSGIYGLAGVAVSRSEYRNPGQAWRPRIFDNRFILTLEGGYRPSPSWEFSARWVYAGGRPYTPMDVEASAGADRTVLDLDRINGERLPDFHSLNLRVDRRFVFGHSSLTAYASVWNVYGRRNVSAVFWNSTEDRPDELLQWGTMPVLGVEYEF